MKPEERLLPGHHAETLSAAQLAAGDSASDEGDSEPESSSDVDDEMGGAAALDAKQDQHRGTKRSRREAEEGAVTESIAGHDRDAAGVLSSVKTQRRVKLTRNVHADQQRQSKLCWVIMQSLGSHVSTLLTALS